MRPIALLPFAALALAGCKASVDLEKGRGYLCARDAGDAVADAQCPAGWHCAVDSHCRPVGPGDFACERGRADCDPAWTCGLDGRCHDKAAPSWSLACDPDAGDSDCTGGFRCGLDRTCHDRDAGLPYPCRPEAGDVDCERGWRCGLEATCHEPDAGFPYLCRDFDDTYCEAGWRCGLDGVCLHSSIDGLDPESGANLEDGGVRVSPLLPDGLPTEFAASSEWMYQTPFDESDSRQVRTVGLVHSGGRLVMLRISNRYEGDGTPPVVSYFSPQVPVSSLAAHLDSVYATDTDGGLWLARHGDAGVLSRLLTLGTGPHRLRLTKLAEGWDQPWDAGCALDAGAPDGGCTSTGPEIPVPALAVLNDEGYQLLELFADGGVRALGDGGWSRVCDGGQLDLTAAKGQWYAACEEGLYGAPRYGRQLPDWVPMQTPGIGHRACDGGQPAADGGRFRPVFLRPMTQDGWEQLALDAVPVDAGPGAVATHFGVSSPVPVVCGTEQNPLLPMFEACPPLSDDIVDIKLPTGGGDAFQVRCRAARPDGGPAETVRSFYSAFDARPAAPLPPELYQPELTRPQRAQPGTTVYANARGDVVIADEGYENARGIMLPHPPDALLLEPMQGGPAGIALAGGWMFQLQPGLGLVRHAKMTGSEFNIVTAVANRPAWLMTNLGAVFDVSTKANTPVPVARQADQPAKELDPPYHARIARLPGDAGYELVVSSNDVLLAGDVTAAVLTGASGATFGVKLAPDPRSPIIGFALLPPEAPAGDGGVPFVRGYALTPNRLSYFEASSQHRWDSRRVEVPEGDFVKVWVEGARARLGYQSGLVISLPSRVPLAPAFTNGTKVTDYAAFCGKNYAVTTGGLMRLEPSRASPVGDWVRVTLAPGLLPPGDALSGGKLFPMGDVGAPDRELYLVTQASTVIRFEPAGPCPFAN